MSLTVVTPLCSSSIAFRTVPSSAISAVSRSPTGVTIRLPHSKRVSSDPIPGINASERWVWAFTSPGVTIPVPSPTTAASGCLARNSL